MIDLLLDYPITSSFLLCIKDCSIFSKSIGSNEMKDFFEKGFVDNILD